MKEDYPDRIPAICPKCNKWGEYLWNFFGNLVTCELCKNNFYLDYSYLSKDEFPYIVIEGAERVKHHVFSLGKVITQSQKKAAMMAVNIELETAIEIKNAIMRNKERERLEKYKGFRVESIMKYKEKDKMDDFLSNCLNANLKQEEPITAESLESLLATFKKFKLPPQREYIAIQKECKCGTVLVFVRKSLDISLHFQSELGEGKEPSLQDEDGFPAMLSTCRCKKERKRGKR